MTVSAHTSKSSTINAAISPTLFSLLSIGLTSTGAAQLVHFPPPPNTGVNMSVLITAIHNASDRDTSEIVSGTEIAAFTPEDILAGADVLPADQGPPWGVAAWGDDSTTPEKDGYTTGDSLKFRLWDPETDEELPLAAEPASGALQFEINGFVALTLYKPNSVLELTPAAIDFGEVHRGERRDSSFVMRNSGTSKLAVRGIILSNENFGVNSGGGFLIDPSQERSLTAAFSPLDTGNFIGQIDITSNSAGAGPRTVLLSGTGSGTPPLPPPPPPPPPPADYKLHAPYPNPFDSEVTIGFELPDGAHVVVGAYDIRGRSVLKVLSKSFDVGSYSAPVNTSRLAPGVYLFVVKSSGRTMIVKGVRN